MNKPYQQSAYHVSRERSYSGLVRNDAQPLAFPPPNQPATIQRVLFKRVGTRMAEPYTIVVGLEVHVQLLTPHGIRSVRHVSS